MTKQARRRLFYSLVAVFFVLGAGVVLYAQGWRFDFTTGHVDKVGAIYVRSFPTSAAISLDGKPVKNQSGFLSRGTFITDLFPRIYNVALSEPNYHDWQESVGVESSLVTEIKYAVLVPSTPTSTASTTAALFFASQKTLAAADASDTVETLAAAGIVVKKGIATIGSSTVAIKKIALVRSGLLGILQNDGSLYLYDAGAGTGARALRKLADTVTDFSATDDGSMIAALERRSVEIFSLNDTSGPNGTGNYYRFNLPDIDHIQKLIWYKDESHLFVVYPSSVAFLDFADAGLHNFTTIAAIASGTTPAYDPQADALYITRTLRFDFPQ